jgi:hypothetical protein
MPIKGTPCSKSSRSSEAFYFANNNDDSTSIKYTPSMFRARLLGDIACRHRLDRERMQRHTRRRSPMRSCKEAPITAKSFDESDEVRGTMVRN